MRPEAKVLLSVVRISLWPFFNCRFMLMSIFNWTVNSIPCQSNNTQYSRQCRCLNYDQNRKVLGLSCAVLCRSASTDNKMEKWKTHISKYYLCNYWTGPGSSVGIATGYGLDGLGIESWWGWDFPHLSQTDPGAHPASCTMGTGSFPRVKSGRGVTLTPHPLLVPWSRKGRAIPILPLWAVQPVQSLSARTRVHLTLPYL
jgi:hypothetical protein